jgi:drug/metabolite transporter (DMT)-like permease
MRESSRTKAYLAFAGFCILSSSRDVISEIFFKDQSYGANPVFVLFVYSAVTQAVAGIALLIGFIFGATKPVLPLQRVWKEVLLLNLFTLTAFLFYFVAISSPLGASVNSFVDYGSGPIFVAIVGAVLIGEHLDKIFTWSAIAASVAIVVFAAPRLHEETLSLLWIVGLIFALLSSLSSAFYRVYFKVLLEKGLSKSMIVLTRLTGITVLLGAVLLLRPELYRADILAETALIGVFGVAIPLFLVLGAIQRLPVRSYAMLLFLLPALTYILSASLGYGRFYLSDLLASGLLLLGVTVHEAHMKRLNRNG